MKRDLFSQADISKFSLENSGRSIYHDLKNLGRPLRLTRRSIHEKCELIIYDGKVTLRVNGSEIYYVVETDGNSRVELYYTDLLEALENDRSNTLNFIVQERTLVLHDRKISCLASVIQNEKDLAKYGLGVLNFGEVNTGAPSWMQNEVWELPNGDKIHGADITKDIENVLTLLKKYKVDPIKLRNLILEKMRKV